MIKPPTAPTRDIDPVIGNASGAPMAQESMTATKAHRFSSPSDAQVRRPQHAALKPSTRRVNPARDA